MHRTRRVIRALALPLALPLALLVTACGGPPDLPYVDADSAMEKTIPRGSSVTAQAAGDYGGRSGDIVVMRGVLAWGLPADDIVIRRVIAVGGNVVECCDAQNRVLIDGAPLREGYLYFTPGTGTKQAVFPPVTVPRGMLWVMGDSRNDSADSRAAGRGPVPRESVIALVTGEPAACSPGAVSCPTYVPLEHGPGH